MKNLITEIATDFKYTEGEYYFSTTYKESDFWLSVKICEGEINDLVIVFDLFTKEIPRKAESLIKELILCLVEEGFEELKEAEKSDKDLEETNNSLIYNFD